MGFLQKNKMMVVVAIVVIVLLFIFYSMSGSSSSDQLLSTETVNPQDIVDDRELLQLLTDMRNIHLDGNIFESTAYISLQDFSRTIIPEPVGREDPFAEIEETAVVITGGEDLSDDVLLR